MWKNSDLDEDFHTRSDPTRMTRTILRQKNSNRRFSHRGWSYQNDTYNPTTGIAFSHWGWSYQNDTYNPTAAIDETKIFTLGVILPKRHVQSYGSNRRNEDFHTGCDPTKPARTNVRRPTADTLLLSLLQCSYSQWSYRKKDENLRILQHDGSGTIKYVHKVVICSQ